MQLADFFFLLGIFRLLLQHLRLLFFSFCPYICPPCFNLTSDYWNLIICKIVSLINTIVQTAMESFPNFNQGLWVTSTYRYYKSINWY